MAKEHEVVNVWTDGDAMRLEFEDASWSWDNFIHILYDLNTGSIYVTQEGLCVRVQGTKLIPSVLPNEVVDLTGWTRGAVAMVLGDWLTIWKRLQEIKELEAVNVC